MKHFSLLILFFFLLEIASAQSPLASDLKKLDWLEGTWIRTNNKPGRAGKEIWTKASGTEWRGTGISLQGNDTVFVEKLKVILRNGGIAYVADLVENKEPVYFQFTAISEQGFVCENPLHDFPKKISYQLTGGILKATISGGGKSVDYYFKK